MSIHKLPEETICKIFSLSTHARLPSFMLPGPDIEPIEHAPYEFDNVTPDVLASVCKRWREIVLSDPILWSTLFLSLCDPADRILRQAGKIVDHCLERSGGLPLSCFLAIDSNLSDSDIDLLDHKLIFDLLPRPLLLNQKRWRHVDIHIPSSYSDVLVQNDQKLFYTVYRQFELVPAELSLVESIRLDTAQHFNRGFAPMWSCTAFKLDFHRECKITAIFYLGFCPNVEKLDISALDSDGKKWHRDTIGCPFPFYRLRSLTLDAPLSALRLLSCPALEHLTIEGGSTHYINDYNGFLSRGTALRTFHIRNALRAVVESARRIPRFLVAIPTVTHLILSLNEDWSASAFELLRMLAEKHTGGTDTNSETFRLLPALEHVELIGPLFIPLSSIAEFVTARWRAKERTLASLKLKGCFIQSVSDPEYTDYEPGMSSTVRAAMKPFTEEDFVFESS